jgi:hypothetical protein
LAIGATKLHWYEKPTERFSFKPEASALIGIRPYCRISHASSQHLVQIITRYFGVACERRLDIVEVRNLCQAIGLNVSEFVAEFDRQLEQSRPKSQLIGDWDGSTNDSIQPAPVTRVGTAH